MKKIEYPLTALPFMKKGAYYRGGQLSTVNAVASTALVVDRLYAVPLCFNADVVIDRLAIEVTTAASAGGVARFGVYSDDGLYPKSLLVDAGEVITTGTGAKEVVLAAPLMIKKTQIIWLAFVEGVAASQLRVMQASGVFGVLGVSSPTDLFPKCGYYHALAYAALPAAFPSSSPSTADNQSTAVMARIKP